MSGDERAYLKGLADEIAEKVAERLPDTRPLLTVPQLGERLGITDRSARKLIEGRNPAIKSVVVGKGSRRVEQAEVDRYVASLRDQEGSDGHEAA